MNKQEAVKEIQHRGNELLAMAQKIETMLPDNLPEQVEIWATESNLRINIPFDWQLYRQLRRKLGKQWKRDSQFSNSDGDLFITHLAPDGTDLTITMKAEDAMAVCERRQIGIKEVPIYQVVCH